MLTGEVPAGGALTGESPNGGVLAGGLPVCGALTGGLLCGAVASGGGEAASRSASSRSSGPICCTWMVGLSHPGAGAAGACFWSPPSG
ncbi:hypothetical protein [Micromonospora sp. NPDC004551]|uniref:hypothetical protein n=1 Tax=Micromonospora sp. NPDC004551 TaxID=3154284 RepID=UPI0033BEB797